MASENDWPISRIEELQADSDKAIAIGPFGSKMKSDCYVPSGVPVIRGSNISDSLLLTGDFVYITEEKADELRSCNVYADDLVFPHRGAIGEVAIVPRDGTERYMLSTSLMKLTCNRSLVEPLFLFYFFRSALGRHELLKHASTVGTPGIGQPLASLKSMRVPVPSLPEQKAIAHILGTLDDKIELNRRMNETLEAMTRAIFKSWFVDFDPVRAKMDGRQPAGMDAYTAALFPDSFEHQNGELIPSTWITSSIGECAINHDSRRVPVKEKDRVPGPYPYYGASGIVDHVDGYLFDGEFLLVAEDGENLRTRKTPVAFRATGRFWVNNHAHIIAGPTVGATRFLLLMFERTDISGFLTGSTIPKLSQRNMNAIDFILPKSPVLDAFERVTSPIFALMDQNRTSNETFAALRDTLLPKLLSGEIRISEADKLVEATL